MSKHEWSPLPPSASDAGAIEEKLDRAQTCLRQGDLAQAERIYEELLEQTANQPRALHLLGIVKAQTGRPRIGLELIDKAIALKPDYVEAYNNRGNVLKQLGRLEQALANYDKAIALKPDHAEAYSNRGLVLQELKRFEEALASCDRAIALRPDLAEARGNRELVLQELRPVNEVLTDHDKRIALKPAHPDARATSKGEGSARLNNASDAGATEEKLNRAVACKRQGDLAQAERICTELLEQSADQLGALHLLGIIKAQAGQPQVALELIDKAIALQPDIAAAYNNRGSALQRLRRPEEALASYDKAIALDPNYAMAYRNRGGLLEELKRLEEAAASYERAVALNPEQRYAFGGWADCLNKLCDWGVRSATLDRLKHGVATGKLAIQPFVALGHLDDPALLRRCAEQFAANEIGVSPSPLWRGESWRNEKIKIAYLSTDFREHAVANAIAEAIERHDRARFEIIGISLGRDDRSEMRARLATAFDRFLDVRSQGDEEVAKLLASLNVDVAVDLNGYTGHSRTRILAHGPAPIQVNYLGFPGTMGAKFVDYIIADAIVAPFDQQPFYTESIVQLPGCYLPNDRRRKISANTPTRAEAGLPENGFVFCSFNNNWKITPQVFDVWMRILKTIEEGVLWLRADNAPAERNLKKEAQARGVDPQRLVFAPRMDKVEDHLARQRLADLFLDTLPYNAHATAGDALLVGLPVLTCTGKAFPGRVATSLLQAIGLPELVTASLTEYEALALALARDPARLGEIKAKLARNRDAFPLFDTDRFCRGLEAAYLKMWEHWQTGQKPQSFAISAPPTAAQGLPLPS